MSNMEQQIRFCTTTDDVRIAYATVGEGPPLVRAATPLTHLEYDWESPVRRHWLVGLSKYHTLIRYDERSCGLSDWDVAEFSVDAWVRDFETVIDDLGLDRFPIFGTSQGVSIAIAYAVRHPEKVSHLILYGGYARGRFKRDPNPAQFTEAETLINIARVGWGQDNPAFRQVFANLFMPKGTPEQVSWLNNLAQITTSPENAATLENACYNIDVSHLAPKITAPTLVLHPRDDAMVPFEQGRQLAAMIPNARFVPLESQNHILLENEPAWQRFLDEVHNFIGTESPESKPALSQPPFSDLTERELELLELIAQGLNNTQIVEHLVISPKTVRNHITNIFSKLQVTDRVQAVVLARDAGLGIEKQKRR